jgi:hypothetical protein
VSLAWAALSLFAVVIEGAGDCPAAAAVEERLRPLLSPGPSADVARLTVEEQALRVTLVRADGSVAGSRVITGRHTCDELADAAAVVISTWQLEATEQARLPAPPPPAPVAVMPAPAPAPPGRWRWELGAGGGAALSGSTLAPAALLVGVVARERWGLAARAHVSGNRETALPVGSAVWRRALLAVGPQVRFVGGPAALDAQLGLGASWLHVAGRGFADARRHDDLVFGLGGGLRISWSRPGLRPWLEASAAVWPGRSVVHDEPDQRSATLPRLELLANLGLSFGR